ncbi:MAG: ATP-binding protein [Gammaproteobacteria bacterium]
MKRIYEEVIEEHVSADRQMIFLAGPRQVGKTTISVAIKKMDKNFYYINWDNVEDQHSIIRGPRHVFERLQLNVMNNEQNIVVFDEIHKFSRWKQFLKGFFDTYSNQTKIIVTGSAKLDVYKRIGDSLMGRYFLYRIHPLSVAEVVSPQPYYKEIRLPKKIPTVKFQNLIKFGGFPEPFLKADNRFYLRWSRLRYQQTFHEDIRSLTEIQEMAQLEMLATLLKSQTGQLVSYSNLAQAVNVSVPTIKRWIDSLSCFYYCFTIKPWFKNVSRALTKQPKIYLWDWSEISDEGARTENFVAVHLLKAVQFWTDYGLGDYDLYFLRDKEKREVDFLVTKNKEPWFLVEAKNSVRNGLNKSLIYFHEKIQTKHAFQVAFNMSYIDKNCFDYSDPVIVPVQTFLSQLV